ncbi:MAG TPA: DUF459 domain-containing protein [Acidimicrobiia bacterium]|nr:DUF459 domain-containing protein [Acidimicrobiia bacterium]
MTPRRTDSAPPRERDSERRGIHWHADEIDARPRRTMPVARIWAVAAIALLVGSLLNAPGIRKTALGQEVGWRRDVATFLGDALYDVSHTIGLDRPRDVLKDVIGRGDDDEIDLTLPSPTLPVAVGGDPSAPPPVESFSPSNPLSIYVAGDSLAQTPGESVVNQGLATGVIGLLGPVDSHVATGLARPEVFNWPAYLAGLASVPDALVIALGSNDDQSLTGDGGTGPFGTPEWEAEYRRRVGGLMDSVIAKGTTVFWVGIPPMRNAARFDSRYRLINDIARTEAEKRPGDAVYVDTVPVLSAPGGGYADYLGNLDGSIVQVRAGDGIHFTRAGGDRIATAVLAAMRATFDLESWQQATTTTVAPTTAPEGTTTTRPVKRKGAGG